jgi:transposase
MEFRELSDEELGVISSFPPPKPKRRALSNDRSLINAILYVLLLALGGVGMPRKYGSYVTAGEGLEDFRSMG